MKTVSDPRHQKRREALKELFALSFYQQPIHGPLTREIKERQPEIDKIISQNAPVFSLEKMHKIDLAILRLSVFELLTKTAPPKVVIDEAVELAKEFGNETSFSFVNGVLGSVLKKI